MTRLIKQLRTPPDDAAMAYSNAAVSRAGLARSRQPGEAAMRQMVIVGMLAAGLVALWVALLTIAA